MPTETKLVNKPEPRFDRDYVYGRQGELLTDDYLSWIARGNGRVEVKTKRTLDFEFYIETECDKGRQGRYAPSGINGTEADAWAFVVGETGLAIILPTSLLRAALNHPSARPKEGPRGNCPTRGMLVNLGAILSVAQDQARLL